MFSVEGGFAFVLVPVYYLACVAVARQPALRRASWPLLFLVNWVMAGACFSIYSAATHLGDGKWLGVAFFSGFVASAVGTALAVRMRPREAGIRGEAIAVQPHADGAQPAMAREEDSTVMVYHFETFDDVQRRYVRSGIRATLAAIESARGKALPDSGKQVPLNEVSPSGFFIFGTNS